MTRPLELESLLPALKRGDRRILARAISHIENQSPSAPAILDLIYPHTGRAAIVGVTGAPGTGKSTLVNALALYLRHEIGLTLAIVAVDPSSPFSRGAVLGDRIRMRDLSGDTGVFIRSMASRGSLGGLARTTLDVVRLLDAAGFDLILIETVGAGQSEVSIASAAHTTIVVEAPGLGDDIQATKAGILEIADILAVNKADLSGATKTERALKQMLDLGHRVQMVAHHGRMLLAQDEVIPSEIDTWAVPVIKVVSTDGAKGTGIAELYAAIQAHQAHLAGSGLGQERERQRLEAELAERLGAALLDQFLAQASTEQLSATLAAVQARQLAPDVAVQRLLAQQPEQDYQEEAKS